MAPVSPDGSTRSMVTPVCTSTPSRRSTSVMSSDTSGSSEPASRGPASTMVTRAPKRPMTCPISRPMAPPPMTRSDAGTVSAATAPRFVQCGTSGEHRRDEGTLPGGEDQGATRRHRLAVDLDRPGAGDPGPAPDEVAALALEAVDGHRVVPGVGGLLPDAPGHRRPVGRHDRRARHAGDAPPLGQEVRGPHHHLGGDAPPVRALTADELGLDADDVEPGLGQLLRDLLTARAEPDDDGVDLHRIYSPPQLVIWTGATIGVPTSSWIW